MERKLLKAMFEQSTIPMAILDLDYTFLYTNQAFCNFTGYSLDELHEITYKELSHIDDFQKNVNNLYKLKSEQIESFQMEIRYIHKEKQIVWGLLTASLISDDYEEEKFILAQIQDITVNKKIEERLKENEKQYKILAENSSDIIAIYSLELECQYVSPSIERRLGYIPHELIGKNPLSIVHPEDIQMMLGVLKHNTLGQATNTIIHRLEHKDGHYIWFESQIKSLMEENSPKCFLVSSREITKRIQILDELENSNKRINNILESITDGFITLDLEDRFIYVNKAAEKIINKKRYEVLNQRWYDVYSTGVNIKLKENYLIVKSTRIPVSFEAYFKILKAWYTVRLYPTKKGIAMYFLDITKQKKLEIELLESEERYRTLVESSPEAISVTVDDKFVYMNPAGFKLLGAEKKDDIIGKSIWNFLPEDEHPMVKEKIEQLFSKKENTVNLIHTNLRTDGTPITVSATSQIVTYNGSQAVQAIVHDITERKKMEEWMQKSEKLSLVGQLAAGVAHEVRNPLTSVKGFIQLAKMTNELKPSFIDIVLSELERTEAIIYEFLSLAKPNEHSLINKANLNQVLNTVIPLLETQALMCNIEIVTHFEEDFFIMCDSNQLKQVFSNLIKNAIEASYTNGIITITTDHYDNDNVIISIKDTGCGIPKEKLTKLGEPFYTTKEKGTGLGLLITYKIIESHNGKMAFTSNEGIGTTVDIILPKISNNSEVISSNKKNKPSTV